MKYESWRIDQSFTQCKTWCELQIVQCYKCFTLLIQYLYLRKHWKTSCTSSWQWYKIEHQVTFTSVLKNRFFSQEFRAVLQIELIFFTKPSKIIFKFLTFALLSPRTNIRKCNGTSFAWKITNHLHFWVLKISLEWR